MLLGTPTSRTAINAASFETFFEGWLVRQEHYLDELLCARRRCQEHSRRDDAVAEEDLRDLIARVLSHYQEYYEEKSRAASRNVFLVFSPTWFTPFERTFFWIAGFKPGLAFRLVENAVDDLTEDQNRRIVVLMNETKAEERELADQMARIQESVAAPPMLELARREGRRLRDGEIREVDAVLETLRSSMELVLGRADSLRRRTAERVAAVLSPPQNVKFLAAATQLQYRIRMWGLNKEAERQTTN
ncbi:hypothetical protein U1Q18_008563 [Sarracenia purpurea var. burkii]